MKVVRIDTAAMSIGSSARNDAYTKIKTSSAPAAPNSVSTRTLGPSVSPPCDSMPYDVRPLSKPLLSAALFSAGSSGASM